jgi:ACS family tartrate transporter-like MFS transporter
VRSALVRGAGAGGDEHDRTRRSTFPCHRWWTDNWRILSAAGRGDAHGPNEAIMKDVQQDRAASGSGGWEARLMRWFFVGRPPAANIAERTRRRIWVHLLPILFFLYILAYIDRSNVSIAKFGMNRPPEDGGLGFDDKIVGFGSGIFFWGYWILEIPSTLAVEKRGARRVFCRILVLWGLCAVLMGFMGMPLMHTLFGWLPRIPDTWLPALPAAGAEAAGWSLSNFGGSVGRHWNGLSTNPESQFYFLRFMLGFFEGGFFPTVVMYVSLWFTAEHRAKAMASFMAAMALSNVVGAPLSKWISYVDWGGLPGWRWIYILEGIAPVVAGIAVLFCLPDRPQTAAWLPAEEKDWLSGELAKEHLQRSTREHGAWRRHLGMVALITAFYFCQNVVSYSVNFFMPSIIARQFGATESQAAWLTALFFFISFLGMQLNGWHSDRKQERIWHVAGSMATVGVGLLIFSRFPDQPVLGAIALFVLVGTCLYSHVPPMWAIPTMFLGSSAAASAIGFINMTGNLGGSVGPTIVGDAAKSNDFATAFGRIAIVPFIGVAIILLVGYLGNRRRSQEK